MLFILGKKEKLNLINKTNIYKQQAKSIHYKQSNIDDIKQRNKFYQIKQEEVRQKVTTDSISLYYKNMFVTQPVLFVKRDTSDKTYLMSYDMNGTFTFGKKGVVYASISSASTNPLAFGNFSTIGESAIGKSGILITSNFDKITFPKPIKFEGDTIIGENYTIKLNQGWKIRTIDKKGNMEITKA